MTHKLPLIIPKVSIIKGQVVTTTEDVAYYFGKQHHHVVHKVEHINCSKKFTIRNFSRMVKNSPIGSKAICEIIHYQMTKDGFIFLVMGFTGRKAAVFKEAYITEFNRMEAILRKISQSLPGKLTVNQQTAIKKLVKYRANELSQDKQAKAEMTMWSALKSHFGKPYKDIPEDQFTDVILLIICLSLEKESPDLLEEKETPEKLITRWFEPNSYSFAPEFLACLGQACFARLIKSHHFYYNLATNKKPVLNWATSLSEHVNECPLHDSCQHLPRSKN